MMALSSPTSSLRASAFTFPLERLTRCGIEMSLSVEAKFVERTLPQDILCAQVKVPYYSDAIPSAAGVTSGASW